MNQPIINELAKQVYENSKLKGFHEDDETKNIGEMLALVHAEVSEALEADRVDKYCKGSVLALMTLEGDQKFTAFYKEVVKGTFEEEMADIVIRVMDMCAMKGIDLDGHIRAKMRYNSTRPYKHGKKY